MRALRSKSVFKAEREAREACINTYDVDFPPGAYRDAIFFDDDIHEEQSVP